MTTATAPTVPALPVSVQDALMRARMHLEMLLRTPTVEARRREDAQRDLDRVDAHLLAAGRPLRPDRVAAAQAALDAMPDTTHTAYRLPYLRRPVVNLVHLGVPHTPGVIACAQCQRPVELTRDWDGVTCACGQPYGDDGTMWRTNWRQVCAETGELGDDHDD